jgi:hypothetical protein
MLANRCARRCDENGSRFSHEASELLGHAGIHRRSDVVVDAIDDRLLHAQLLGKAFG